jgi:hypothetical protein
MREKGKYALTVCCKVLNKMMISTDKTLYFFFLSLKGHNLAARNRQEKVKFGLNLVSSFVINKVEAEKLFGYEKMLSLSGSYGMNKVGEPCYSEWFSSYGNDAFTEENKQEGLMGNQLPIGQ